MCVICTFGSVDAVDVYTHVHTSARPQCDYSILVRNASRHLRLISMRDLAQFDVCCGSFIRVTGLFRVCDMNRSCVQCDAFMCVMRLISMRDLPHSDVCCESCMCAVSLTRVCDVTRLCVA